MIGFRRLFATGIAITALGLLLTGCACSASQPGATQAPAGPKSAVDSFYKASSKHGTLTFVSGKEQKQDRIEYWFEGDRYRLTWFNEDGSVRIHMISPDGKAVYNCYAKDQVSKLSYVRAEFHQAIFNGPEGWTLDAGVPDGDLTAYTYVAKKLWTVTGSSQDFYLEDLVVYADDTRIVKAIARTDSSKPDDPSDLVTSRYEFDPPELGVSIPAEKFELPWKIVPAE